MGVLTEARKRVPYFTTEATVEVDIDPDDLHADGWHHETECPAKPSPVNDYVPPRVTLIAAVASLHRQAHPSQHASLSMCHEEPCRSLSLAQLRGAT